MSNQRPSHSPFLDWLPILLLTALAAAIRFYALDRLPPGLYHDEAYNGLDALSVLQGDTPIFFEANNGREPLFIYLIAASIASWGRSPWAIRFVSACLGTLTIPATYAMAAALLGRYPSWRRLSWLTAFLMTATFWPLNLSRIGFRAVALPFFSALTIWFFWRGLRKTSRFAFSLAGLCAGLSLYTYLASRFVALFWIILAICLWLKRPPLRKGLIFFALTATLTAAPLAGYGLLHPAQFWGRTADTSILSQITSGDSPWTLLPEQIIKASLMFIWRGDFIPRHNLPYRPVFDLLIAPAFILGICLSVRRLRQDPAYFFVLLWVGWLLLPTILAENAPHFLRAVGVLPVACLLPALGIDAIGNLIQTKLGQRLGWSFIGLVLASSLAWTCRDYFLRHAPSEALYYNMEAGAAELAVEINQFLDQGWQGSLTVHPLSETSSQRAYLDRRLWDGWASLRYLVPSSEALTVIQPAEPPAKALDAAAVKLFCWPYADYQMMLQQSFSLFPANALITAAEGAKERGDLEREPRLLYLSFAGVRGGEFPRNLERRFEQGIVLSGYAIKALSPNKLAVRLFWQATAPLQANYTVFVHVRRGEQMSGQDDAPPGKSYYPTNLWRVGDTVMDEHIVSLNAPYTSAQDEIWVGMYHTETQKRLQWLDAQGAIGGDYVILQTGLDH